MSKKEKSAVKSRKVNFWKSQKLLTERALSKLHGGSLFRTFNSYSFNFNGGLCKRRTAFCLLRTPSPRGQQFLLFLKIDLLRFHHIYLLFDWSKLWFSDVLIKDIFTWSVSKYDSCWCFGFQWVTLWRSDKFLLTLSVVMKIDIMSCWHYSELQQSHCCFARTL